MSIRRAISILASTVLVLLVVGPTTVQAKGNPKITWYFGLARPEAKAEASFFDLSDPSSPNYRHYLSQASIRARYGASARTIGRLKKLASARGLAVAIDPTGTFARVTGRVSRMERVFGVKVVRDNSDGPTIWGWEAKGKVKPPAHWRPLIREIMPMYNRFPNSATRSRAKKPVGVSSASSKPVNQGTWLDGCDAARATGGYSFAQVRKAYGIDQLGDGSEASVAILNAGEGLTAQNIRFAAKCFGQGGLTPQVLKTDGQTRPFGLSSFEPPMDLALVRGMAPAIDQIIFTQVWESPQFWFLGPARLFAQPELPDSLSVSYGECENQIVGPAAPAGMRPGASLFDAAVVRLGLAGVGTYAASGDTGSDCGFAKKPGVLWPGSSPYVTSVGGTRLVLDADNQRVDEVVWNDFPWLSSAQGGGAGGGGFALYQPRPPFQSGLPYGGQKRLLPDVSAHASALPGWPVNLGSYWQGSAGTSAATPLIAAAFAVISGTERKAGRNPIGPSAGLLYDLDASDPSNLFDIVEGNNGVSKKIRAWRAGPGFDLASGLGVPVFDRVQADLPAAAPGG